MTLGIPHELAAISLLTGFSRHYVVILMNKSSTTAKADTINKIRRYYAVAFKTSIQI